MIASTVQRSSAFRRKLGRVAVLSAAVGTLVGGAAVLGGAAPAGAVPVTLYVSPSGHDASNNCTSKANPCQTLNHANNIVTNGETISLAAGTFRGNIEITKNISIVGVLPSGSLDATNTTINAEADPGSKIALFIDGASVSITNVVVDGGGDLVGGIFNEGGDLTLTNVSIENNLGEIGGLYNDGLLSMTGGAIRNNNGLEGAGLFNDGLATVKNVSFTQNSASQFQSELIPGEGGAIFNDGGLKLAGTNPIHNNSAVDGGGIEECSGKGVSISLSTGTSVTSNAPNDFSKADPEGYC